ncbi:FABP family protein [Pseudaquidulcibacter saccharophilus]|uniref:FABP family protein n=1 Tax=Pseudaquidulcibacter saccharophilus TaxID=2831900 RepID=UPI001EFEF453|nr:heme-binding beta-barrel domain-containing protein [Pseudaquidulcibacter saccharophilus]
MAKEFDDIYTEPEDVDPNTLDNLGPLSRLAGIWEGVKGSDTSPKEDGPETRKYKERIEFQAIDPQANGPQLFYGLRYHVKVNTDEETIAFHDQVGYWLWEPATGLILQTIAIPRGLVAIASGHAKPNDKTLKLKAVRGETEYGICATTFLEKAFRTESYEIEITFHDDGTWSYVSDTMLRVQGQKELFRHHDENFLKQVGKPKPNPMVLAEE